MRSQLMVVFVARRSRFHLPQADLYRKVEVCFQRGDLLIDVSWGSKSIGLNRAGQRVGLKIYRNLAPVWQAIDFQPN